MIRAWVIVKPVDAPSGPLGDPFTSRKNYMTAFVVLERMMFMRLTDGELAAWANQNRYGTQYDAKAEQERRRRLEE